MDRYEVMQIFIRVAELQSFTQAAASLDLPKATVSTSIQTLEIRLATKLLNRTTRHVQVTVEGAAILERCKEILSGLEEAESMFRREASQITGSIRVDMSVAMANMMVLPRLAEFLDQHPGLEVQLSSSDRTVDLIREGFDCVIRGGKRTSAGTTVKELGQVSLVNWASPNYLARYGTPRSLSDLAKHKLVHYAQVLGSRREGFEYLAGDVYRDLPMPGCIEVNNTESYNKASLVGLGIIQAPRCGVRDYLASGELVEILPEYQAQPMSINIVYPQRRVVPKRVRGVCCVAGEHAERAYGGLADQTDRQIFAENWQRSLGSCRKLRGWLGNAKAAKPTLAIRTNWVAGVGKKGRDNSMVFPASSLHV